MAALQSTPLQCGQTVHYLKNNYPSTARIVGTITEHSSDTQTNKYLLEGEGPKQYYLGDNNFSKSNMIYENPEDLEEALNNRII